MPDLVNCIFEAFGGFFIGLSVLKLHRDKQVRGVALPYVLFYTSWGYWNLYYYPSLGQWASFWGGFGVVAVNTVWFAQILYYRKN